MRNKIVVVTGAARGIGAATARVFLGEGHTVLGVDILPSEMSETSNGGIGTYEHHLCDVSDETSIGRLFGEIREAHGRVDVLANIAGVVVVRPFLKTTWDEFRQATNVNIGGVFLTCRAAIPLMPPGSAIVNMASISGHIGQIDHIVYSATKAAVIAMCRGLAWELAPRKIRVNSVSPGSVDTAMLHADIRIEADASGLSYDQVKAAREAEQALGRWAQPEEIVHAVAFLASDRASFITGTDLLVDAGWVAR